MVFVLTGIGVGRNFATAATWDPFGHDLQEPKVDVAKTPRKAWRLLRQSSWIGEGKKTAPRVIYEFYDANCPYCQSFWSDVQPWIRAGKLQLRYIPVGLLDDSSLGKAAALLLAGDPEAALSRYAAAWPHGKLEPPSALPADVKMKLAHNLQLMYDLGLKIVPGIVVRNADASLQLWPGLPSRQDLRGILGAPH